MKLLAMLLALPFAAFAARQVVVPPLPEAVTPDVEVCTNVALNVNAARLQSLAFSVSFDSCATNEVLVAIGADSDGNGDLSMDEVDVVFGCDCGAWYRADLRTGETAAWPTSSLVVGRREFDRPGTSSRSSAGGRAKSAKASLPTRNASASAS